MLMNPWCTLSEQASVALHTYLSLISSALQDAEPDRDTCLRSRTIGMAAVSSAHASVQTQAGASTQTVHSVDDSQTSSEAAPGEIISGHDYV